MYHRVRKWKVEFNENVFEYSFGHNEIKVPYFLEYSPGLELNPFSNWIQINFPSKLKGLRILNLYINPLSIWTQVIVDHEINYPRA